MKRFLISLLLLFNIFFACAASAAPAIPAKPQAASGIYVQDYAGVITSSDRQKILSLGQELDNKTTAQLAVITVKTLEGEPIEDYALAVLRSWGIGTKAKNNGALIVVATEDRQSRMEIGYGLEGILPDGLTGRIQDQYMLPYFKQGQYSRGILQGYFVTASVIAKDADVKLTGSARVRQSASANGHTSRELSLSDLLLAAGIMLLLIIDNVFLGGFITRMLLFSLFRRGGGGGFGGGGGSFGGGSGGGGGSSRRW